MITGMEKIQDWREADVVIQKGVVGDTADKVSFAEMSLILDKCKAGDFKKVRNLSGIFITIQLA